MPTVAMSHFESTTSVEHCALRADVRDGEVLVDDPLARVDEHERDVGPLGRLQRAQLRVVLDALPLLALAAQAGGVDEHERPVAAAQHVSIESRVVPGMSETITRSSPSSAFSRLDLPTFGRPRIATRIASSPTSDAAPAGQPRDDRVEQVAGAVAVQAGERDRVAEAEPVELERERVLVGVVDLVREQRSPACASCGGSSASSSSPGVIPARASTTKRTRSASSTAARAWSAIERVIGDGSTMSTPPVSIEQEALAVPVADELLAVARHARASRARPRRARRSAG